MEKGDDQARRYEIAVRKYLADEPMTSREHRLVAYGFTAGTHDQAIPVNIITTSEDPH